MTSNDERLYNIEVMYKILDVFLENKELYDYYKKEVPTYLMIYNQLNGFKEEFFKKFQEDYKVYIEEYELYNDIKIMLIKKYWILSN